MLGSNAKIKNGRTNTDLDPFHDRAVAKSIFKSQTKGQKIKDTPLGNGGVRRTAEDGTQIRFNSDGSTRLDLPHRGTEKIETIHFNP